MPITEMANAKKTLSKNLTQMKFMRRLNPEVDEESESSGALIEKWEVPNHVSKVSSESVGLSIVKYGFMECENLDRVGRFSYNKFNKEVERLSRNTIVPTSDGEDEGTITPKEVAKRYEEITSKKFTGKRKRTELLDSSSTDRHGFKKPAI